MVSVALVNFPHRIRLPIEFIFLIRVITVQRQTCKNGQGLTTQMRRLINPSATSWININMFYFRSIQFSQIQRASNLDNMFNCYTSVSLLFFLFSFFYQFGKRNSPTLIISVRVKLTDACKTNYLMKASFIQIPTVWISSYQRQLLYI